MFYLSRLTVYPFLKSLRRLSPGPLHTHILQIILMVAPAPLLAQGSEFEQQNLMQTVASLESRGDFWHPRIAESMASLGMLMQREGRHEEAIDALERAAQVSRVNHGIFSLEQAPLLALQVESHMALERWEEADQLMRNHFYIHVRAMPEGGPGLIPALDKYAGWHLRAFMENRVPMRMTRLVDAYQLNRLIIKSLEDQAQKEPEKIEHYLRQMAFIVWRLAREVHNVPASVLFDSNRQVSDIWVDHLAPDTSRVRTNTLRMGEAAMEKLVQSAQQQLSAAEGTSQYRQKLRNYIRARLDLADWYLTANMPRRALAEYQKIRDELSDQDPALASEMLKQIVVLPAYDYVLLSDAGSGAAVVSASRLRSVAPTSVQDHINWEWADIEFDLNRFGDVTQARVKNASTELGDAAKRRIANALLATQLRPMVDAEGAVAREGLVHRFYYHKDILGRRAADDPDTRDAVRESAVETAFSDTQ